MSDERFLDSSTQPTDIDEVVEIERKLNLPQTLQDFISTYLSDGKPPTDEIQAGKGIKPSRGTSIYIRRLKQSSQLEKADVVYKNAIAQKINRVREKVGKPATKEEAAHIKLYETFGEIMQSESLTRIAALGIGAVQLLYTTHEIEVDERKKLISEIYDMNDPISGQIVIEYNSIRDQFERVIN